eukprot:TRINITY_DN67997_c0_g1_i1.p1 TRINITY_DN67997_c0_g1~~TRINITY_DN67997_c0_g1_i1.p1  ORF type:complete len:447 (-),score=81.89 TRINITY_DN67997_c0_g1_i1:118-1458(-)
MREAMLGPESSPSGGGGGAGLGGGSVAEAALEAWVDCKPDSYAVDNEKLACYLDQIASRLPVRYDTGGAAEVGQLFTSTNGEPPIFIQMLKPQDGKVHFLYFWKAFGEASRIGGAKISEEDNLVAELEMLRDRILRKAEEAAHISSSSASRPSSSSSASDSNPLNKANGVTNWALSKLGAGGNRAGSEHGTENGQKKVGALPTFSVVEEVHRAASMSACPQFWAAAAESLESQMSLDSLSMEEITSVLLSWLHEAALWDPPSPSTASAALAGRYNDPKPEEHGLPVRIHVYDVSQEESIQKINRVLAHKSSPIRFGGVFHAGVEVNGLEWSFGFSASETHPGVSCVEPKTHPQHHYRQTVYLGRTIVQAEDIADIITDLIEEYPGDDYDLLRRNCCHFADDFSQRLGVGGIPGWVIRLARLGATLDTLLQSAPRPIKERLYGPSDD